MTQIKEGSLVAVYANAHSSVLDKIISDWEGGNLDYLKPFHFFIAVTVNGEQYALQADKAGHFLEPITYYNTNKLQVFVRPDHVDFDTNAAIAFTSDIDYSFIGAAESAIEQYTNIQFNNTKGLFCSQLAALLWKHGGYKIDETSIDPYELQQYLLNDNVEYYTLNN